MDDIVTGGITPGAQAASKGKRIAAGVIDLFFIPIVLGVILGLILLSVPEKIRTAILMLVNIGWLIFRDTVFSPGRALVGIKVISNNSGKLTIGQAVVRNVLLIIPVVLIIGYIVELVAVIWKGRRVADQWAKTDVVQAA